MLRRAVEAFLGIPEVGEILVITGKETEETYRKILAGLPVRVVPDGGETRQQSVFGGIRKVSEKAEFVAIHDGARPLVKKEEVQKVIADAKRYGAAVLGVRVKGHHQRSGKWNDFGNTGPQPAFPDPDTPGFPENGVSGGNEAGDGKRPGFHR